MTAPRSRTRRLALTVALSLLLAACAPWGMPDGGSSGMSHGDMPMGDMHGSARGAGDDRAPAPVEDAAEVRISASEMAFAPAELNLVTGEVVNVTVTNDGQLFHDFAPRRGRRGPQPRPRRAGHRRPHARRSRHPSRQSAPSPGTPLPAWC